MGKTKIRRKISASVQSPTDKSVVSARSPYFDEAKPKPEEHEDSLEVSNRPKRTKRAQSSTGKYGATESVTPSTSATDQIKRRRVSDVGQTLRRQPRAHYAHPQKSVDETLSDDNCDDRSSDSSYHPSESRSRAASKNKKSKKSERSVKDTKTPPEGKSGSHATISQIKSGDHRCSNAYESAEDSAVGKTKKRKRGNLRLFSEFPQEVPPEAPAHSPSVALKNRVDDSEDEDWEDVKEETVTEVDFLTTLLGARSKVEQNDTENVPPDATIALTVPLHGASDKNSSRDPAVLEAQAKARRLKELYSSMHLTHVLCYLSFSRSFNRLCDGPTYRALGLSLLADVKSIRGKKNSLLDPVNWTMDHLSDCVSTFLTRTRSEEDSQSSSHSTIFQRLADEACSTLDCTFLLISALRAVGFDVRLVVGLTPLPSKPPLSDEVCSTTPNVAAPKKKTKTRNVAEQIKNNRKIISSDDSDFEPVAPRHPKKSSASRPDPPRFHVLTEVFLPTSNRWICIDLSNSTGLVDKIPHYPSMLYVLGMTTTYATHPNARPYAGRNPVDLASRYDRDWCGQSRLFRLPADRWSTLLEYQRLQFTRDAAWNNSLVSREEGLATVQRDRADEDSIRSGLLAKPLPEKVQDFKNHPLYILPRHLLKFEVIHPPDALPLGFFRGEPIYSRDCLHLCHTRESWLKEAKVVKPFEKPAKVVKARASLKRKLLQGSDPTPPMVEIFGSWQVEDYQPPVAQNGVVPRNIHGTIDLFKPCMLPIGCAHVCLTGIQHIAKKLSIDCAPAITGWKFHGSGWAIPIIDGYVVCKEAVPALIDAWRATQMNAVKAAAQERSDRALDNWRRLVRGLFLWHRVKAQFALAPLHPEAPNPVRKRGARKSERATKSGSKPQVTCALLQQDDPDPAKVGSLEIDAPVCVEAGGWQRLVSSGEQSHQLPIFPVPPSSASSAPKRSRGKQPPARGASRAAAVGRRGRRKKRVETSSEEEEDSEPTPDTSETESSPESD